MKNGWVGCLALGILIASTACGGGGQSSQSPAAGTIKVGYPVALTGQYALFDGYIANGIKFAVDEINSHGGVGGVTKIDLVTVDQKSDSATTAVVAQQLADQKVSAMFAMCNADQEIALATVAKRNSIPVFAVCNSNPAIAVTYDNWIAAGDAWTVLGAEAAEYMASKGYHNVYTLESPSSQYYNNGIKYMKASAQQNGLTISGTDTFIGDQTDFGPQVTKLAHASPKPDVLYTPMAMPNAGALLKQIRAAGLSIPFMGGDGMDSPLTLQIGGDAATGLAYVTHGFPAPGSATEKFYSNFNAKYGSPPKSIFTAIGYNVVQVFASALQKSGSSDPAKLTTALNSGFTVSGSLWDMSYKPNSRNAVQPVAVVGVQGGQFVLLNASYPKFVPPVSN